MDVVSTSFGDLGGRAGKRHGANHVAAGRHVRGCVVDDGVRQLHDDHHPDARSGHDHVPVADDDLGYVHHGHPPGVRSSRADCRGFHATDRPRHRHRVLRARRPDRQQQRDGVRRRPTLALATLVLVLFAPGRVHHDSAGDGDGVRHHQLLRAKAIVRLQADGLFDFRNRRPGLYRLGPPYVRIGHEPDARYDVHGLDHDDRAA